MTEQEFLDTSKELMAKVQEGYDLCLRIQDGLNDDYRNNRITYEEWQESSKETKNKMAFFREQFDMFSTRFERLKKH